MASKWRHLPNALCVLRMVLIVPIAIFLLQGQTRPALITFALAALTDALDGFLAKRFGWQSELGKRLDPLADKLLLVTLFIVVACLGLVPVWLAAAAVLRDVVITAGGLTYLWLYGDPRGQPTVASKLNTLLQVLLVLGVLAGQAAADIAGTWGELAGSSAMATLMAVLGAVMFVTTVVSGLDYVLRYSAQAREARRALRTGADS
jgi:cardiolipin synthase (CMP-forming)